MPKGLDDRLRVHAVARGTPLVALTRSASVHLQAGILRQCVALVCDPKANGRREYRRPSFASEGWEQRGIGSVL